MSLRVGLVGYGAGGRRFHTPYIQASPACDLVGVVTRSPKRAEDARADSPGITVYASLTELLDAGVDIVVISTPPETRRELALEAIRRGVNVVADKPFAPSARAAQDLVDAASVAGVLLNVFHNRRFDTDIVTAREVLAGGELGTIRRLDLRCDQDDASAVEAGSGGGLLRDLGTHVADQAIFLLGPATAVTAQLDWMELAGEPTDTGFVLSIEHGGGVHSHVSSSKLSGLESRELRLHGTMGSYISDFTDVQVDAVNRGVRPVSDRAAWGYENPDRWGTLYTREGGHRRVPSAQGDYTSYYDAFADAVLFGGRGPVPGSDGVEVLRLLDAARTSAVEHRTVTL
jgi:predicted dehydrogenase